MSRLGPCPLCENPGPWENAAARAAHIRAHHTVDCDICGQPVNASGLGAHRAGHRRTAELAAAAPPPPGTLAEVLAAMLPGVDAELVDRVVEFIEQAKEKPAPGLWVVVPLNGTRPWLCRSAVVGHTAAREHVAALIVPVDDIYAELNRPRALAS